MVPCLGCGLRLAKLKSRGSINKAPHSPIWGVTSVQGARLESDEVTALRKPITEPHLYDLKTLRKLGCEQESAGKVHPTMVHKTSSRSVSYQTNITRG